MANVGARNIVYANVLNTILCHFTANVIGNSFRITVH